ncbi:D-amino acid dehydrogenase [Myxosarcina sp. GI1]|uniref:D-amino acid dehydrogenase n=1 Tax=Myxosarcina sp. GI1 TaxID=1541065 RepID=UPI000565D3C5|nr:D-amino acid dehydrogenase [Myxosarcina sp. GI1]
MQVCVLGAGVVGVTTAWYLQQQGYKVTVIDRQSGAGLETSFANGGQISVSHAEPWANPRTPAKILKWLLREDAPLLFRLKADLRQWLWGLNFLRECTPARARHNLTQLLSLGTFSRNTLQALRAQTGIEYDCLNKGIPHFYTSSQEFEAAVEVTQLMQEFGCGRQVMTPEQAVQIEPALQTVRDKIVGATYTAADESGDAHQFTQNLAKLCQKRGTEFLWNTCVHTLETGDEGKLDGIQITRSNGTRETLRPDLCVVAMGSYSSLLLSPLGINLQIYPVKGYSATFQVEREELAYTTSLTDDEYKLVFSRLGDRLRVAGTAELNGYNLALNTVRCEAIVNRVMELFPGAITLASVQFWTGLRPSTPSNLPYIGTTRYSNLFVNTGHGTLGWTHACGSGKAISDIITGRQPEVNFEFKQNL